MRYVFEIYLNTDGDFEYSFVPSGMNWDGERYSLKKKYFDRKSAVDDINEICSFLKENISGQDYVVRKVQSMFGSFLYKLNSNTSDKNLSVENEYIGKEISGNYDGTEVTFRAEPQRLFDLPWTDEEMTIIYDCQNKPTQKEVKKAVLSLYQRKN